MNISFYNGASGLVAHQEAMNQVSHNIANVNTVGYKPFRPEFTELLYNEMYTNEEKPLNGHGVKAKSADWLYGQGPIQQTWNSLDFAVSGDGFFAVQGQDGNTVYTRNGAFDISVEGRRGYLVDAEGRYVLDGRGRRITMEKKDDASFDLDALKNKIGVFQFANPYALQAINSTSFLQTEQSGQAEPGKGYTLLEQALEGSGVQLADEMTNMIVTQRAYQMSARVVRTADEMEEIVNNLR